MLSCSVLAARANGCKVDTLEGLQEEAEEFGSFIAGQGAEQCGFCNPGMIMNAIALFRENPDPSEEEIKEYLAGNLCRCSGYEGQLREFEFPCLEKAAGRCVMSRENHIYEPDWSGRTDQLCSVNKPVIKRMPSRW